MSILKCDVCGGDDFSELNKCHICNRNYCELCEGNDSSTHKCELCSDYTLPSDY